MLAEGGCEALVGADLFQLFSLARTLHCFVCSACLTELVLQFCSKLWAPECLCVSSHLSDGGQQGRALAAHKRVDPEALRHEGIMSGCWCALCANVGFSCSRSQPEKKPVARRTKVNRNRNPCGVRTKELDPTCRSCGLPRSQVAWRANGSGKFCKACEVKRRKLSRQQARDQASLTSSTSNPHGSPEGQSF